MLKVDDRQTDGQTDLWIFRKAGRHTDGRTDKQTDRQANEYT